MGDYHNTNPAPALASGVQLKNSVFRGFGWPLPRLPCRWKWLELIRHTGLGVVRARAERQSAAPQRRVGARRECAKRAVMPGSVQRACWGGRSLARVGRLGRRLLSLLLV